MTPHPTPGPGKLLDLFCGAGGSAKGYHDAGFTDITGVDNRPQKRYPYRFVLADALEYLAMLIESGEIEDFDLIHASPPCQKYAITQNFLKNPGGYPDLVAPIRALLKASGRPYVIENVPGAPLENPVTLCGSMFGLPLIRHRLFECNPPVWFPPAACACSHLYTANKNGTSSFARGATAICVTGERFVLKDARQAMGIDWMNGKELNEAIPPAYTRWLARQMMRVAI